MEDKKQNGLIKVFSTANADGHFSVTRLSNDIKALQNTLAIAPPDFTDWIEKTLLEIYQKRANECAKINIDPEERLLVARTLAKINFEIFSKLFPGSVSTLNEKLRQNNINYAAPVMDEARWREIVFRMKMFRTVIVNILLYKEREIATDVSMLSAKHFRLSANDLKNRVIELDTSYKKFMENAPFIEKMKPYAIDELKKLGWLKINLDSSGVLQLGQILFKESLAAKYSHKYITEIGIGENKISQSAIIDYITLCLVKENSDELN